MGPEILFVNEFGQLRFEYQTCEDRQPVSEKACAYSIDFENSEPE